MEPRIKPAQPPYSDNVQKQLDVLMPSGVPPLTLFTMLARDERLFSRFMGGGLLDKGNLSLRHREIVIDRVTALCGSEYEWGVHVAFFGARVSLSEDQIYALVHGGAEDECWTDKAEKTLIKICDCLQEACTLSDELWKTAREHFSEEAILEILMLAGFYRTVSYLTNAAALPLELFAARFPEARSKTA